MMARTAQRQRQVETLYAQNLRLRSKLTELCAAVESGEIIKARRLALQAAKTFAGAERNKEK